jgi:poly(A) polymerase
MVEPSVLFAALESDAPAEALRALDRDGALCELIPELEAGRGFVQPELHHFDVMNHNLAAVEAFERTIGDGWHGERIRELTRWFDLDASLEGKVDGIPVVVLTRLACLLHDVAKPATATRDDDGRLRFPRHGPEGALLMKERLPGLGVGATATDLIARLIRQHLRPAELVRNHPATDRAVRKFTADVEGHVLPLMLLNLADGWATRGPSYDTANFERHCNFLNYVVARSWAATEKGEAPLVSGEDLMQELPLQSGRLLGAVLTSIRRAQEQREVSTRAEALELAWRLFAETGDGQYVPTPAKE